MGAGRRVSCPIQDDDGERVRLRFDLDKRTADRPAVCGGFRVPLFPEVGVRLELRRPALGLSRCRQAQSPTPGRSFSGRGSLPRQAGSGSRRRANLGRLQLFLSRASTSHWSGDLEARSLRKVRSEQVDTDYPQSGDGRTTG